MDVQDVEPLTSEGLVDPAHRPRRENDVRERAVRGHDDGAADRDDVVRRSLVTPLPGVQHVRQPAGRVVSDDDPRVVSEGVQRTRLVLGMFGDAAPK